jgi:hypothetical protein
MLSCYSMSDVFHGESQLQRLKSSVERLRRRARPAATRASDRLARQLTRQVAALGSLLAEPELLHWSARLTQAAASAAPEGTLLQAAVSYVRRLWKDVAPLQGRAVPLSARIPPPFICDRELVASMQL